MGSTRIAELANLIQTNKKAVEFTRESSLELHDLLLGPGLSLRPVVSSLAGFSSFLNS